MRSGAFVFLAALAPWTSAMPKISTPTAGQSIAGGTAITVTWADDGVAPLITALTSYQLFVYSGSGISPLQIAAGTAGQTFATTSSTITVPIGAGGSTTNAYFIGIMCTATGGTVTTYSSRFTLTGMTGTFPADVITANAAAVADTAAPAAVNNIATAATGAATGGLYVAYSLQTGLTKYAAMQPVPPTAITQTVTTPQYPTSSFSLATTFLPIASQVTTLTQAQTFSVSSHANTAAAASQPVDDMQKFLNRWKD